MNAIFLRKDMPDESFIKKVERQMLEFPNSRKDDVIDGLTGWVNSLDNKGSVSQVMKKPTMFFNKATGKMVSIN